MILYNKVKWWWWMGNSCLTLVRMPVLFVIFHEISLICSFQGRFCRIVTPRNFVFSKWFILELPVVMWFVSPRNPRDCLLWKIIKLLLLMLIESLFRCFQCSTSTSSSLANFTRSITLGLIWSKYVSVVKQKPLKLHVHILTMAFLLHYF